MLFISLASFWKNSWTIFLKNGFDGALFYHQRFQEVLNKIALKRKAENLGILKLLCLLFLMLIFKYWHFKVRNLFFISNALDFLLKESFTYHYYPFEEYTFQTISLLVLRFKYENESFCLHLPFKDVGTSRIFEEMTTIVPKKHHFKFLFKSY